MTTRQWVDFCKWIMDGTDKGYLTKQEAWELVKKRDQENPEGEAES